MVRVNLVKPSELTDQHLIAEYNEILMLVGHVRKYPKLLGIPEEYCLGKGHIKFFKNKLVYLKKRHEQIKKEMRKRGFKTRKTINLKSFKKELLKDWRPQEKDIRLIKKRITEKIEKKPDFYRFFGKPFKRVGSRKIYI